MTMMTPRRPIDCTASIFPARLRKTARPLLLAMVGTVAALANTAASARDYTLRDIGPWTVAPSKDGKGCFLTRDFDGDDGTTLLLGLDIDGTNRLSVLNPNWSIKPKDQLKLNFRLSNSSYPAHFAIGIASDGKQGFVTSFGAQFPTFFGASKALRITRGTVPVAQLALDGAKAAVSGLQQCVDDQRNAPVAASAEKRRSSDIPKDPFASISAKESKKHKN